MALKVSEQKMHIKCNSILVFEEDESIINDLFRIELDCNIEDINHDSASVHGHTFPNGLRVWWNNADTR